MDSLDIADNLQRINTMIEAALSNASNPNQKVALVAVTKNRDVYQISQILKKGHLLLGENRVQELRDKYEKLPSNVEWHLIGHLQKNKVKYVTDKVKLVHSLDSYSLALEINKRMEPLGRPMNCLVQINVASEDSKFGLEIKEAIPFIKEVSALPWVKIKGLMTIAPEVDDPEEVRPVFKELANLFRVLKGEDIKNIDMEILSMGMTNDFQIAIEEGANMVRIGSAIFGSR